MKRWLCFLLLPEVALGYVGIGMILMIAGYDFGWLVIGAGMAVMFGFEFIEDKLND